MAVTKTLAWGDGSTDNITLSANAWSGNQNVTISTPENFGKARSLNIVFYSTEDSTASATVACSQQAATLGVSPLSLEWGGDETGEWPLTITTNISTSQKIEVALSGANADKFQLGSISAVSGGKATITIAAVGLNQTSAPFTASITISLGNLQPITVALTQKADAIISTQYSTPYFQAGSLSIRDSLGNILYQDDAPGTIQTVPAAGATYTIRGVVVRTKTVVYESGTQVQSEEIYSGSLYYITYISHVALAQLPTSGSIAGYCRAASTNLISATTAGAFHVQMNAPSLGSTIVQANSDGFLGIQLSTASYPSGTEPLVQVLILEQENNIVSFANYGTVSKTPSSWSVANSGGSITLRASVTATATYTSGSTATGQNVPLQFSESLSWISTGSYSVGPTGGTASPSTIRLTATANTGASSRSGRVSILTTSAFGGAQVGSFTISQAAGVTTYVFTPRITNDSIETISDSSVLFNLTQGDKRTAIIQNVYGPVGDLSSGNWEGDSETVELPGGTTDSFTASVAVELDPLVLSRIGTKQLLFGNQQIDLQESGGSLIGTITASSSSITAGAMYNNYIEVIFSN